MSEPMSVETLEEIDELLHSSEEVPNELVRLLADEVERQGKVIEVDAQAIECAESEVERLRAENAAMRPVVAAVAEGVAGAVYWNRDVHRFCCRWCNAGHALHMTFPHDPDCRYEQARAVVATWAKSDSPK